MRALYLSLALVACGSDDSEPPVFAEDYETAYTQVRGCRNSLEHDLRRIRVMVSPDALTPYNGRTAPFPVGSIVLKVEHDDNDPMCEDPPIGFTVMQRLPDGTDPDNLDWSWFEYDGKKKQLDVPVTGCVNCHEDCGNPPEGYSGTCTAP